MGHLTTRDAYKNLEDRINWFTQGAPPSETLYKILQVLYTEKEAKWVALLPVRPFTLKKAARIWGTTEAKAEKLLDHLCEKALPVDSEYKGQRQQAAAQGDDCKHKHPFQQGHHFRSIHLPCPPVPAAHNRSTRRSSRAALCSFALRTCPHPPPPNR